MNYRKFKAKPLQKSKANIANNTATSNKAAVANKSSIPGKVKLTNPKERTASSRKWLLRQLSDPFVHQAKEQGYRSRAAFKLLSINEKFKIMKPGMTVIDLGAAPGGWSQVALEQVTSQGKNTKKSGKVIAIDLQAIKTIPELLFIQGDFLDPTTQIDLQKLLLATKADVILSDMAAPACGMGAVDHIRIMALLEEVYEFCRLNLSKGGSMAAKVLRGGTEQQLLIKLKKNFTKVVHFKPEASRADSSEMYVVALGFRG